MIKNVMYTVIILAALAFLYRQLVPADENPPEKTQAELMKQVEQEQAINLQSQKLSDEIDAERKRVSKLFKEYLRLVKNCNDIENHLAVDRRRIFRRILHDSLPIYGAQVEKMRMRIGQIEEELDKMGIPESDSRYEGTRVMRGG